MLQSFDMVGINLPMIIMTYDYLPSLEVVAPRSLSLPPPNQQLRSYLSCQNELRTIIV